MTTALTGFEANKGRRGCSFGSFRRGARTHTEAVDHAILHASDLQIQATAMEIR